MAKRTSSESKPEKEGFGSDSPPPGPVAENNNPAITMAAATSIEVTAALEPENASNQNVTWGSDNESHAIVTEHDNPATITAVAAGSCTVTVTTEDGSFTDTVAVTVT